jgi:3-mercaptopyruvate sulfurtransferase SseA
VNRRIVLSLLAVATLALAGCSRSSSPPLKTLTVDELAARLAANDGKTFVYDNNPEERYQKGHVPGAHWLDFHSVSATDLPADKSATLVFYCANEL